MLRDKFRIAMQVEFDKCDIEYFCIHMSLGGHKVKKLCDFHVILGDP